LILWAIPMDLGARWKEIYKSLLFRVGKREQSSLVFSVIIIVRFLGDIIADIIVFVTGGLQSEY